MHTKMSDDINIFYTDRILRFSKSTAQNPPLTADEFKSAVATFENGNQPLCILHSQSAETALSQYLENHRLIYAAGGLVRRADKYLLMQRRGYVDLPKGKREAGEDDQQNALREVGEETGLQQVQIVSDLGYTFHTYVLDGAYVLKRTAWFLMQTTADEELRPQTEEDICRLWWASADEVKSLRSQTYLSLQSVLEHC